jgi:trehalose synthase
MTRGGFTKKKYRWKGDPMKKYTWRPSIEDYAPLIGADSVERIVRKAQRLRNLEVVNISSTFYGGGVAEMLSSSTLLARSLGIRADWRLIQGSPDFFSVTKKFHNALQGQDINLSNLKKEIYEEVMLQNAARMDLDCDFVIVHDPQPLPLIANYRRRCPWIWRCRDIFSARICPGNGSASGIYHAGHRSLLD